LAETENVRSAEKKKNRRADEKCSECFSEKTEKGGKNPWNQMK
jgi:hypothetical protein